ncbi:suppressor of SWI4 1 homolog [Homarus americanus]|uniref:suppressor of SWI4 1 homolog n=1 Tax=Homarus americanus TaxID=6706 RepID=UPI001C484267|nr:suppressor of SWI4 1 homolog [Homarus americanus]
MPRRKMGRLSRRNRDQSRAKQATEERVPQCIVISRGNVGREIKKLTEDLRQVMEPNTATKLRHTKNNNIKDFVAVAGQLNITHLVAFSQTSVGLYLKVCRIPHGPTLTFRIKVFARSKDVLSSLKKHRVHSGLYITGPCLMTNLQPEGGDLHLQLSARMFLDMFPTITPNQIKTDTIQRCCLINYDPNDGLFDFRHYSINVVPVGISKAVKKFNKRKLPDLSSYNDVSEFMTKAAILSESEAEDDPSAHVMADVKVARRKLGLQKSSVRLSELGPRLSLELMKIEEGLLDGKTLYNRIVTKTDEEKLQLEKKRKHKKQLKMKRKKQQQENVDAKTRKKDEHKKKCLEGMGVGTKKEEEKTKKKRKEEEEDVDDADWEDIEDDDAQYYRDEVGEEPDPDLFMSKPWVRKKRKIVAGSGPIRKKFKSADKNTKEGIKKKTKNDNEGMRKTKKNTAAMRSGIRRENLKGRKITQGKKFSGKKSKKR